ncbi:Isochorismatase, partial [Globisporangium splendens]
MLANVAKRVGRLVPSSSVLFVCDVQEVFRNSIFQLPTVVHGTNSLVSAAKILDIPIVVTTQYAARFGDTVAEINQNLADAPNYKVFDKTLFSMMTPEVDAYVEKELKKPTSVILCGIEGHVCVLQTCLDLLDKGYEVHVIADAVSSSTAYTRSVSLERMRQSGAFITSVESSIFQLARDSKNPKFKDISKLIKEHLKVDNGFDTSSAARL